MVLGSALVSVCVFEWLVAIWFKFYSLGVNGLLLTCLGCWVALGGMVVNFLFWFWGCG